MPYNPIIARLAAIDASERAKTEAERVAADIVIRQTEEAARNYRVFTMYSQPRDHD